MTKYKMPNGYTWAITKIKSNHYYYNEKKPWAVMNEFKKPLKYFKTREDAFEYLTDKFSSQIEEARIKSEREWEKANKNIAKDVKRLTNLIVKGK